MPITQISRIQVRHGYHEALPQLSTGEFGWCLDTKQLFIGNGTIEEGAPSLGNTEILTEFSDIFALRGVYTYKGERGTYTVITGPSTLNPIQRSLQDKLDDFVSARDFGAVGDGVADDTAALNKAITQLYKASLVDSEPLVRRTLFIPAGTYKISAPLKILPYVTLRGEGKSSTFIVQTLTIHPVAITTDSEGRVGLENGLSPAVKSQSNVISDLTLKHEYENDILVVDNANDVLCRNVGFRGPLTMPTIAGTAKSGVKVVSNASSWSDLSIPAQNLVFDTCSFSNIAYGITLNNNAFGVTITGSRFNELYQGVVVNSARGVSVTQNYFDLISAHGVISASGCTNIVSAYNFYNDVGNALVGTPTTPAVSFDDNNCYSLADGFTRTDADADVVQTVTYSRKQSAALTRNGTLRLGTETHYAGREALLLDNASSPDVVPLPTIYNNATISYEITRDVSTRVGTIKMVRVGANVQFDDDYSETSDVGVTLIPTESGGKITLNYTSTSTTFNPVINYTITSLT